MHDDRFKLSRADFVVHMPDKVTGTKEHSKTFLLNEVELILSMDIHYYKFILLCRAYRLLGLQEG
jgi:hypothetical protein